MKRFLPIKQNIGLSMLLGMLMLLPGSALPEWWLTAPIGVSDTVAGDFVAASSNVELGANVEGDVYTTGGNIAIRRQVNGEVLAVGGGVALHSKVRDDFYAAGGSVQLDGEVGGNVKAVGGHLSLSPEANIEGRVSLFGASIEAGGRIGKNLKAMGDVIRLGGEIRGDVDLTAREVEILPGAKIRGKLRYYSPQPAKIDPAAVIQGGVSYLPMKSEPATAMESKVSSILGVVLALAGLALFGGLLLALFPTYIQAASRTLGSEPGKSLVLGFALLVSLPVAVVLLLVTVVGIPIGLAALLLYPLALVLGYLTVAFYASDKVMTLLRQGGASASFRFTAFLFALILLAWLTGIPVVGGFIAFLSVLLGLGAWMLYLYRMYSGPELAVSQLPEAMEFGGNVKIIRWKRK